MPSLGIELSAAGLTGVNISQSKVASIRKSPVKVGGGGLRDVPAFDMYVEQNTLNMYAEKVRVSALLLSTSSTCWRLVTGFHRRCEIRHR